VVESDRINEANMKRIPAMLCEEPRMAATGPPRPPDRALREVERLAVRHLPPRGAPRARTATRTSTPAAGPDPGRYLATQLDTLRRMYDDMGRANYHDNFAYLTSRTLHVVSSRGASEFGDVRIFKASELRRAVQERGR
jgi:hypothetical protein